MTLEEAHKWIIEQDIGVWHLQNEGWEIITGKGRVWYMEYGPKDGCWVEHPDFLEAIRLLQEKMAA